MDRSISYPSRSEGMLLNAMNDVNMCFLPSILVLFFFKTVLSSWFWQPNYHVTWKSTKLDHVKTNLVHKLHWNFIILPLQDFKKIILEDEYTSCEKKIPIIAKGCQPFSLRARTLISMYTCDDAMAFYVRREVYNKSWMACREIEVKCMWLMMSTSQLTSRLQNGCLVVLKYYLVLAFQVAPTCCHIVSSFINMKIDVHLINSWYSQMTQEMP